MRRLLTIFGCITLMTVAGYANTLSGETIYNNSCKTCHNPATAPLMKAPVVHDKAAWQQRFDAAKAIAKNNPEKYKDALAVLVETVKNGKGAMPAGGLCVNKANKDSQCSDAEYASAIQFMMHSNNENS